jgi:hypothetical protein
MCTQAITGVKEDLLKSFISLKDKGGLTYPSSDVTAIWKSTELLIQRYLKLYLIANKQSKFIIVSAVLEKFFGIVFVSLSVKHNMSAVENHELLLIRTVTEQYLKVRLHHICRQRNERGKIRTYYKKLILFRGD